MNDPILEEIRQTRDDLARETGCDLHKLFAFIRTEEAKARVREEPPKP